MKRFIRIAFLLISIIAALFSLIFILRGEATMGDYTNIRIVVAIILGIIVRNRYRGNSDD